MSQLNYYGADPRVALPHRGGLVAWGIVLIVLGGLAVLLTVFSLVFAIAMAANLIPGIKGQSPATFFVAIPVYTVVAVFLIWMGIGSRRGRRWVRPLMIIASTGIAASGVISVLSLVLGIIHYVLHPIAKPAATPALPFDPALIGFAFGGCFALLLMVVLAASFTTFAFLGNHQMYFDLLFQKIPAQQRQAAEQFAENSLIGPALMYVVAVVYAVAIRNRFGEKMVPPAFPVPR